jgi:hypothetical protein
VKEKLTKLILRHRLKEKNILVDIANAGLVPEEAFSPFSRAKRKYK